MPIENERLKSYVARIETLNEEKSALTEDIRDLYTEVKSAGYDVKIVRQLIKIRKMDVSDRQEQESLLDTYKHAMGMDLPLLKRAAE